jgi:hypothetical protein
MTRIRTSVKAPTRWRPLLLGTIAIASSGFVACSNGNDGEDNAELNAILKDGDLGPIGRTMSALSLSSGAAGSAAPAPLPPPPPPMGAGGTTGAAGTPGAGGSSIAGSGGSIMTGPDGGITMTGMGGKPMTGIAGAGGGGPFPQSGQGFWHFDDCNSGRTDLSDSSFNRHTAFRAVSAACAPSIDNQGIAIDGDDDLVYVPDQPTFTFENGLTVAAWVKPNKLGGIRTIFRKRENGTSTFVLAENGKDYQLVVRLANGKAAEVSAKATLNTFTHVAGTYDGHELRLYINGQVAAKKVISGTLSNGEGPLLMGNDADSRRIDGVIDNVFFDVFPATPDQVVLLMCLPHPSTFKVVPPSSGPVAAGTQVDYDIQFANNSCDQQELQVNENSSNISLFVSPGSSFALVEPGTTAHQTMSVTSTPDLEPDDYLVNINAFVFDNTTPSFQQFNSTATYSIAGGPCSVRSRRELEITDLSVVEDPVRTASGGAWTFGTLMRNMATSADAAPAMVEALLSTWATDQTVNTFSVFARPSLGDTLLTPFPRLANGQLDLDHAPFRLLAIVNRIDLNDLSSNTAGEGRFVFGALDQFGNPLQFTMILEYRIPVASAADLTNLADAWHGLGSSTLTFPSEDYNKALQVITDAFTKRGAAPGQPNDSAIGQVRSNDNTFGEWEFREFHLSATSGHLEPASPALTPDPSFNGTQVLADYINANQEAILAEKHVVPAMFEGVPFQAGSLVTDFFTWSAPGVDPELRHRFARNTCNGCHTFPLETGTDVFQIQPRFQGQEAILSPFLLGTQVLDPFANLFRNFHELGRRGRVLHDLVCPNDPLPPPPPDTSPGPGGGPGPDGGGGFGGDTGGFGGGIGGGMAGASGGFDGGVGVAGTSGSAMGAGGSSGGPLPPPPPPPGK